MRFVPTKEEHRQIILLCLHRTRQGFIEERTATYNRLRGLIAEFGIVLPQKVTGLRQSIGPHLEDLPGYANQCIGDLLAHADQLDLRIADYDKAIAQAAREDARSKRLMQRPGIGPITASALLDSIGNGHDFRNGRQVAAWIGLTPGQHSSGGRARLVTSPKPVTPTCAACSSWAHAPSSTAPATNRTASAAGPAAWSNAAATGAQSSPSLRRMRGWPGAVLHYGEDFKLKPSAA